MREGRRRGQPGDPTLDGWRRLPSKVLFQLSPGRGEKEPVIWVQEVGKRGAGGRRDGESARILWRPDTQDMG